MSYAQRTTVGQPATFNEIERTLKRYGATAFMPKRGLPGVWWRPVDGGVELLHEHPEWPAFREGLNTSRATWRLALENLKALGFRPLRIRITAIRQERLQDITEADAKAEGVADVEAYRALWQAINGKTPGARWDANPTVFVLEFELVRETQS